MATTGLTGKRVLITGGGTGIGKAIAVTFARQGAKVFITGRRSAPLEEVAKLIQSEGGFCGFASGDVGNEANVHEAIHSAKDALGGLDVLVNNAGIYRTSTVAEMSLADWAAILHTNLTGVFLMTRAALPLLKESQNDPNILMISSTVSTVPLSYGAAYCTTKAGLDHFSRCLALEVAPHIRVNTVNPGIVDTPIHTSGKTQQEAAALMTSMKDMQPLGRVGEPSEIAEAAAFLCGTGSRWTTGAFLNVDGGISLSAV